MQDYKNMGFQNQGNGKLFLFTPTTTYGEMEIPLFILNHETRCLEFSFTPRPFFTVEPPYLLISLLFSGTGSRPGIVVQSRVGARDPKNVKTDSGT
jgi:hypothetical protein